MTDPWISQLIGRTVESIEQWDGCPCAIRLSGGYRVQVESLWRLLSAGTLTLTSKDEAQLFGRTEPVRAMQELSAKLVGQTLHSAQVVQGTADLELHFGQETLQVVSDSSGYEAWQIEGPAGTVAVGQGGGNVAVWG
jgi:hypothetical protein